MLSFQYQFLHVGFLNLSLFIFIFMCTVCGGDGGQNGSAACPGGSCRQGQGGAFESAGGREEVRWTGGRFWMGMAGRYK